MKALTVWQPWASLIAAGVKPYEFRGWAFPRSLEGARIAIHAGARPVRRPEISDLVVRLKRTGAWTTALRPDALELLERALQSPGMLPLSHVLCTAVLGRPRRASEIVAEFGGPANDSDRNAHGNWAWPLTDIEQVLPPQPARGAQGFWDWRP